MRTPLDQYPTPAWQTHALTRRVNINGTVLEPCCGDYAIIEAMAKHDPFTGTRRFISNDIDPKYTRAHHHADASKASLWREVCNANGGCLVDWTVTNPPFNVAMEVLKLSYEHSVVGVAFLLRLSFMEPVDARGPWLTEHPPQKMIVLPRWRYNGRGTDSVTTAWFVWLKEPLVSVFPRVAQPIEIVPKSEITP